MSVEGWAQSKLQNLVDDFIVPMRDKPPFWSGNIPWCRIEDIDGKFLLGSRSNQSVDEKTIKLMNLKVFPVGTVICSCSARLGVCAIVGQALVSNQTFIGLVPGSDIDSEYLYYKMTSKAERLQSLSSGTTIAYLPREKFEHFEIEHPTSKAEQTQIAVILSTIDRAIEQTEAIIAKQQRIKTGLMQDLLTKGIDEDGNVRSEETHEFKDSPLGRIPVEWEAKTVGEILNEYGGKLQTGPFGSQLHASEYVADGIPFVMPQDIQDSDISEDDIAHITEERANDLARHRMQTGDIVFARRGDLSRCAVVKEYQKGWVCGSGCFLMKPPKKFISPKWITEVYRYHATQVQVNVQAVGSTMVNLNRGILASLCIPFPTYREQIQIEARLKDVEKEQTILFQQFSKFKQTKTGLMQDLLTGKVRVTELLQDTAEASP